MIATFFTQERAKIGIEGPYSAGDVLGPARVTLNILPSNDPRACILHLEPAEAKMIGHALIATAEGDK